MKKSVVLFFAVMMIIGLATAALAGGGVQTPTVPVGKIDRISPVVTKMGVTAGYDKLYEITLPKNTTAKNVISQEREDGFWYCDADETIPVYSKSIGYFVYQNVPELSKWNVGKVTLSGSSDDDGGWGVENMNGFLSFDPANKNIFIYFAGQYCRTEYTSEYDQATDKWTCTVAQEYTCDEVEYQLGGKVILSVTPYTMVK